MLAGGRGDVHRVAITRAATPRSAMWTMRPGIAGVGDDEVAAAAEDHEGDAAGAGPVHRLPERRGLVHAEVVAGRSAHPEGGERRQRHVLARRCGHAPMLSAYPRNMDALAREAEPPSASPRSPLAALAHAGCASLGGLGSLIQAPRFSSADGRDAEIVLRGPSRDFPLGGAAVRLHARVFNPNPFGVTLSTLAGDLYLEGDRAAVVDFPIGLPLVANGESDIPIDFAVGFEDVPAAGPGRSAAPSAGQELAYRLDGRIGVDAGALGRPTFGPMTIMEGDVRVRR